MKASVRRTPPKGFCRGTSCHRIQNVVLQIFDPLLPIPIKIYFGIAGFHISNSWPGYEVVLWSRPAAKRHHPRQLPTSREARRGLRGTFRSGFQILRASGGDACLARSAVNLIRASKMTSNICPHRTANAVLSIIRARYVGLGKETCSTVFA